MAILNQKENKDEVSMFYDCRYISACEAIWQIFEFDIHYKDPPVEKLSFHHPDEQLIMFWDDELVDYC